MDKSACLLCLAIIALVSGCSSEAAKRTAYETLQNIHDQDCLKDPNSPSECRKRDSYEDYQRQQKALEPSN